ncbi:MAG: hypothetical protein Kapaf2KO_18470 [Candidatus Kapaibacteriales bacterium]
MFKSKNFVYTALLVVLTFLIGCSSVEVGKCPEQLPLYSMGSDINTSYTEGNPFIYGDRLYFTFDAGSDGSGPELLTYDLATNQLVEGDKLILDGLKLEGVPRHFETEIGEFIVFSAFNSRYAESGFDIYISDLIPNGLWSKPLRLSTIVNTQGNQITPFLSESGLMLYYASNHSGSEGYDIYQAEMSLTGEWFEPNKTDLINTPQNDINPQVMANGDIAFSSNRSGDFDIYYFEEGQGIRELEPVNTSYNEKNFHISNGLIYFSSDREGGCGSYDLYVMEICGGTILNGYVMDESGNPIEKGNLRIMDRDGNYSIMELSASPEFEYEIGEKGLYGLQYVNECEQTESDEYVINADCKPFQTSIYELDIIVSERKRRYSFEDYEFPFFATGYYKPMTKINLEELKQQFALGLIEPDSKESSYIENPEDRYDLLSLQIDKAIDNAVLYLFKRIQGLTEECNTDSKLYIDVTGYADPRPISEGSIYIGPDIIDDRVGVIKNGSEIDNILLSRLRAYYTAIEIEKKLKKLPSYSKVSEDIVWNITGGGVTAEAGKDNLLKRHVELSIEQR